MKLLKADKFLAEIHAALNMAMLLPGGTSAFPQGWRESLLRTFVELRKECEALELNVAVAQLTNAIDLMNGGPMPGETDMMARAANMICNTICTEMSLRLFFTVPPERAKFYNNISLFGDDVERAFPSASNEIVEAGKCMALGRYSASVFHLMRTTEAGLKCLANTMQVSFGHDTWNIVLDQIEKAIRAMSSATHGPDWKTDEQFYSEAAAHFRILKNAWRNYTMHLKDTYDDERAMDIYNSVSAFMRHLATKLHE